MIRKRLSMIFSSKVFFIVFSVLVSFVLWMYVEINLNQLQQYPARDVKVVRLNEEVLSDRGLLISAMNPETVNFSFECTRSVAQKLNNTPITVEIDLATLDSATSRGYTTIGYDIVYPAGVDSSQVSIVSRSVSRIMLYIDKIESRQIQVNVPYRGGTAEGYIQDPIEFSPQTITVSGPAEVVSRVDKARVNIIRENLSSTYTEDLPFTLYDEEGEELDEALRNQLTLSDDTIHVTVPIRVTKEVALTVELNPGSGATRENTVVTIVPPTVLIAGNPDDVRDLNNINLGTIDLTRFDYTNTFNFPIVIPNNVTNISGETEASIFVEVLGLEIRHFSISSLYTTNEPIGYTADIRTQSVDVRIRGRAEDMENLTEANIRVVASLTDVGPGTQRVPARVIIDGIDGDVGAVGNYNITVSIARET